MINLTEEQVLTIKNKYGEPYYLDKLGEVKSINHYFWAMAYKIVRNIYWGEHITRITTNDKKIVYETFGKYLISYNFNIDQVISFPDDKIVHELARYIFLNSKELNVPSLERYRSDTQLKPIIKVLKNICQYDEDIVKLHQMYRLIKEQLDKDIISIGA